MIGRSWRVLLTGAFFCVATCWPDAAMAATFVVNSTVDAVDAAPNGVCATAGGVCTLRAAIQEANATGGGRM